MKTIPFTVTLIDPLTKVLPPDLVTSCSVVLEVLVPDVGVLLLGGIINTTFSFPLD